MTLKRNYDEIMIQPIEKRPFIQTANQEYQILLEFDLKRQKQKNLILQQRLKNKQIFIQQMKNFQEQLTAAYEQCKNQLIIAQEKIQYLQNIEFRQYTEQIADLKHMLLIKQSQEIKRQQLIKEERGRFNSHNAKISKNKSDRQLIQQKEITKNNSKVNNNINTQRQNTEDILEQQIIKQINKFSNFITHFLQMASCYVRQIHDEQRLAKKLKKCWKWIKQVVKQWDAQKDSLRAYKKFKAELQRLLAEDQQTELSELLDMIKTKAHKHN